MFCNCNTFIFQSFYFLVICNRTKNTLLIITVYDLFISISHQVKNVRDQTVINVSFEKALFIHRAACSFICHFGGCWHYCLIIVLHQCFKGKYILKRAICSQLLYKFSLPHYTVLLKHKYFFF